MIKFDKAGRLIRENYNLLIKHSDYWQMEIDLAIKENKNKKRRKKGQKVEKNARK